MLHDLLAKYLDDTEAAVRQLDRVYVERYEEEVLSATRINMRIRIRFQTGYLLEVNEAIIIEGDKLKHLNYRYHFQDIHNNLVFRYDNTPHFPGLNSFPHHKHLDNGVVACEEPTVLSVIEETKKFTLRAAD